MSDARVEAVVLLSGGMDSAVAAGLTARRGPIACLHCTYGQRTAARERRAFEEIAESLGARERSVLDLAYLGALGGSALTDPRSEIPAASLGRPGVPVTYVPFRNAQLLAAAVAWAEVLQARRVVYGAVEDDSSGYPDCRRDFVEAFNRLIEVGTRAGGDLRLEAPLLRYSKAQIVRLGVEVGTPFHQTWSCYQDEEISCGACDSCALRRRGFREAGIEDPLPYRTS